MELAVFAYIAKMHESIRANRNCFRMEAINKSPPSLAYLLHMLVSFLISAVAKQYGFSAKSSAVIMID